MNTDKVNELVELRNQKIMEYHKTRDSGEMFFLRTLIAVFLTSTIGYQLSKNILNLGAVDVFSWTFAPALGVSLVILMLLVANFYVSPDSKMQKMIDAIICSKRYKRAIIKKELEVTEQELLQTIEEQVKRSDYRFIFILLSKYVYERNYLDIISANLSNEKLLENLKSFIKKYNLDTDEAFKKLPDDMFIDLYSNKLLVEAKLVSSIPLMQLLGTLGYENYSQHIINQIIQSSDKIKEIFIGFKNFEKNLTKEGRSRETIA